MAAGDYLSRALGCLPPSGRRVLDLILIHGGTSGSYYDILTSYTSESGESGESNSYLGGATHP